MKNFIVFLFVAFFSLNVFAQSSKAQVCFEASMAAGRAFDERAAIKPAAARQRAKRPSIPNVSDVPQENVLVMRGVNYGYFSAKSYEQAVSGAYERCVESTLWAEMNKPAPKK